MLHNSTAVYEPNCLTEGYPEAQHDFSLVASPEEVATTIATYKDLVNRNQVQGNERNIDYWRKQGWDAFSEFITAKSQLKSKTQIKRSKVLGKAITLEETPEWLIVIPLDKDASCYHGKNTDWCTTKPNANHFEQYFYNKDVVLIYFLQIQTNKKWAIACHKDTTEMELFDQQDKAINATSFQLQTGLDPEKYRSVAISARSDPMFIDTKEQYVKMQDIINKAKPFAKIDTGVEHALLVVKQLSDIVDYCQQVKGRWPEAEKLLARDALNAYVYAKDVIKGRWLEAEPTILKEPRVLHMYVANIVRDRWPEAEPVIIKTISMAIEYARHLERGDVWQQLEEQLLKSGDFHTIAEYCNKVVRGRWLGVEPLILQDSTKSFKYASDVVKGRWLELEARIQANPAMYDMLDVCDYIEDAMYGERCRELEPVIMQNAVASYTYARTIIKGRWPEAESEIASDVSAAVLYATHILKAPWTAIGKPEVDDFIISKPRYRVSDYSALVKQYNETNMK